MGCDAINSKSKSYIWRCLLIWFTESSCRYDLLLHWCFFVILEFLSTAAIMVQSFTSCHSISFGGMSRNKVTSLTFMLRFALQTVICRTHDLLFERYTCDHASFRVRWWYKLYLASFTTLYKYVWLNTFLGTD